MTTFFFSYQGSKKQPVLTKPAKGNKQNLPHIKANKSNVYQLTINFVTGAELSSNSKKARAPL
jgi:hypothetical protein